VDGLGKVREATGLVKKVNNEIGVGIRERWEDGKSP